jgi:hypothetical protein
MRPNRASLIWIVTLIVGAILVLGNAIRAAQISHDEISQQLLNHELYDIQQTQLAHDHQIATNTQHLTDIDRRLEGIEKQDINGRLKVIETTMNENQGYLRSTVGGTFLMLIGLAVQFVFTRRLNSRLSAKERKE